MITLDNWLVELAMYGATHLSGSVKNHPKYPDSKMIKTSAIVSLDADNRIVKTRSGSVYCLGEENPSMVKTIEYSGLTPYAFLVKRVHDFLDGQQYMKKVKAEKQIPVAGYDLSIYPDDVLVKQSNGKYMKITGVCVCDLDIKDDEVENFNRIVVLEHM